MSNPTVALIQAVVPEFTLSDLDGAQRAGVIEIAGQRLRFTHPLLASTHYSRVPAPHRRELHRRLAEVVADEEARAHHLALGAEAPDRQLAVTLEQAADRASRRGAPEVGGELLDHACRLTPADAVDALCSRTVASAEWHYASGDSAKARSILEALLENLSSGPIRARALLQLARLRMDDFEASAALTNEALSQAEPDHRVSARAQSLLSELWANRGDSAAAVEHARVAVALAEHTGDSGLLAQTLAAEGVAEFFNGDGVQHNVMARAIELQEHADATSSYDVPSTRLRNMPITARSPPSATLTATAGCSKRSRRAFPAVERRG